MIELYFDGACGPKNPGGAAGYGFVIKDEGKEIYLEADYIGEGPGMTNNIAEYVALTEGLKYLVKNDLHQQRVRAYGDSKMIINMATKKWGYSKSGGYDPHHKVPHLKPYLTNLHEVMGKFPMVELKWIPRTQNRRADLMSKKGMKGKYSRDNQSPADPSKRNENPETYTLFQKVNGASARLYGAILYGNDIEYPQPVLDRLETILAKLEAIGDEMVGTQRAEIQRKNEYNQQALSRKL